MISRANKLLPWLVVMAISIYASYACAQSAREHAEAACREIYNVEVAKIDRASKARIAEFVKGLEGLDLDAETSKRLRDDGVDQLKANAALMKLLQYDELKKCLSRL